MKRRPQRQLCERLDSFHPRHEANHIMANTPSRDKRLVQPASTLILVHGNRYVQAFGDDEGSRVRILNVPFFYGARCELMNEELIALQLEPHWSRVYREGHLLNQDAIRDLRMEDVARRIDELDFLQILNRVAKERNTK